MKEFLDRLPIVPLVVVYLAYVAYDYYTFTSGADSPLTQKQAQIDQLKQEAQQVEAKIKEANNFFKSLEVKRGSLRGLAEDLDGMKATLTESLDVPSFMKTTITEAKKVGLNVLSLKPTTNSKEDYYFEQRFELAFRGVYAQLWAFLDRISQSQKVIRVDSFNLKPVGSPLAKFIELEGVVEIKAYRYVGSKADEVGRNAGTSAGMTAPASAPAAAAASGGAGP